MGVSIQIRIANSVTRNEWEKVYEESLQLIKAFPLAEMRYEECRGIETLCLVQTQERIDNRGRKYWKADGDYINLHTVESYELYRDMFNENEVGSDDVDVLLSFVSLYLDEAKYDKWENNSFTIWGNKTQGESYHIYLLAIACLIEFRLGKKALVHGDITRGQCKHAVELANKYLSNPIDIPDRCDLERLRERIFDLPIGEKEKLILFDEMYLGTKDARYGEYIRSNFFDRACEEYWKNRFDSYEIGTYGFDENIKKYLLWGFDLSKLCKLVDYGDDIEQYKKFIRRIMDAKLHIKDKNCKDVLEIDQEEMRPYTIDTLLAEFVFMGAKNSKVDRYIPIEELRKSLAEGLAEKCDVNAIIDEYLLEEEQKQDIDFLDEKQEYDIKKGFKQSASELLEKMLYEENEKYTKLYERYDIVFYEELIRYKKSNSIEPHLLVALKKSFIFYNSLVEEENFKELMKQPWRMRCELLTKYSGRFLIRDKDWDKIFNDIEENEMSFSRYYPMVRVELSSKDLVYMVIAFVLNDDLYNYCIENI